METIMILGQLVYCRIIWMGNDLQLCVYGGQSHLGSTVVAIPYYKDGGIHVTCSNITILEHKDDLIATMFAKSISQALNVIVCCSCGIHYDQVTETQLKEIVNGCHTLLLSTLKKIKEQKNEQEI